MSIYILKDRTIRMYRYDSFFGSQALTEVGAALEQSTQTGDDVFGRFFPSVNPLSLITSPVGTTLGAISAPAATALTSAKLQGAAQAAIAHGVDVITLTAVEKISINYKAGIAVEQGLVKSFIQPWYIEPATIQISGTSYLGCFFDISKDDKDVERIYKFFNSRLSEGTKTTVGDKKEIALDIVNNPKSTDRFIGYITSFEFSENVEKPYLLTYEIDFVGKPDTDRVYSSAYNTASKDKQKTKNGV